MLERNSASPAQNFFAKTIYACLSINFQAEETSTRICRAPTIHPNLISHSRTMDSNSSIEGGSSTEAEAEGITMNGKDRDGEEMDRHKDMEEETGKTGEETTSSSGDIRDRIEVEDRLMER